MNFKKELIEFLQLNAFRYEEIEQSIFLNSSKVELTLAEFETFSDIKANRIIIRKHEWILKKSVVQSKIISIQGKNDKIHGRQTTVKRINAIEAKLFLEENHLKGYLNAKLKLGCFLKSELVAVMTFGTKRKFKLFENYVSLELIQYATKKGFTVIGGLDKLLNFAEKEFKANEIMTYLDQEWTIGNSWEKLGFECVSTTKPIFFELNPITFEIKKVNSNENEFTFANLGNKKMIRKNQNLG